MSVFMIAALLGLLLYQIVMFIQPAAGGESVKVGKSIKVELPADLYLTIKATVLAVAILIYLGVIVLIVANSVHPPEGFAFRFADVLTSPRMGAAIFGGLVGILLTGTPPSGAASTSPAQLEQESAVKPTPTRRSLGRLMWNLCC